MNTKHQGCGKDIDGWHRCGVMEMGESVVYCAECLPLKAAYDSNQETIQTLKCAIWEAITKLENSPRTCQSSAVVILQRALKDTEDLA